ncbi:MAG: FAD-dependent oxidoreductase [Oscillospiraceae bacterium]
MKLQMELIYPHLFSPLAVKKTIYKNRIVCAPMGGVEIKDQHIRPEIRDLIRFKLSGGAAAFIVGECPVSHETARAFEFYDYNDPVNMSALRELVGFIKEKDPDTVATIELMHAGDSIAEPDDEHPAIGPSGYVRADGATVRELSEADINKICTDFAALAAHCKDAGFDGVLVHMGHGWLFSQFLSPLVNIRTDKFGGSLENRARISLMTLKEIRKACGDNFLIECRISGDDHLKGSYSLDEICDYCRMISEYADIIHVSAGHYRDPMRTLMVSCMYDEHGCNVEVAAKIKQNLSIPVAVVGGINTPEKAEEIIAAGKADLVVLGRQMLADPMFPEKAAGGRSGEIKSCLRCMRCFPGPIEEVIAEMGGLLPGCTINPELEQNGHYKPEKADKPKRVLVVGGGVAGMQAAVTASDRGHKVVLLEKSGELGGILNYARHDKDKSDLKRFADAMAAQVKSSSVEVRKNVMLTEEIIREFDPDTVIAAIGSSPLMPPIPGLDNPAIVLAIDAYDPATKIGSNIIILGGGQVGCETAIHLSRLGKKVTIVEMRDSLAPDAYRLHRHKLNDLIAADSSIDCILGATCRRIKSDGVTVEIELTDGSQRTLSAETVITALGMKANSHEDIRALSAGREYYAIGDCVKARKIYDAVKEGFLVACGI